METTARPSHATLPPMQKHVACHACDYDLHALPTDGHCPECGTSISESIRQTKALHQSSGVYFMSMAGVVGVVGAGNVIQFGGDLSGLGVFLLIWLFTAPLSLLFAVFTAISGKTSWALFWIGLMFVAAFAAWVNYVRLMYIT